MDYEWTRDELDKIEANKLFYGQMIRDRSEKSKQSKLDNKLAKWHETPYDGCVMTNFDQIDFKLESSNKQIKTSILIRLNSVKIFNLLILIVLFLKKINLILMSYMLCFTLFEYIEN